MEISGPPMTPKFFIIDDHRDYRSLLAHHLTTNWPDAEITSYDPVASGRLPDSFSGAGCDLVLLGDPAGQGNALEWLRQFCSSPQFPPVIFFGNGDEQQIVEAIKAGAENYISKPGLDHNQLIEIVGQALDVRRKEFTSGQQFVIEGQSGQPVLPSLKGYKLQRCLSSGSISTVYLTEEQVTGEKRALKIMHRLHDSDEVALDRFLQEFELVGKIQHENVVRIYDLGVADDHAYIAMEYCSRGSLKRRILAGMEPAGATRFMQQIADALDSIHATGILHRDLKPTNVMFRQDDSLAVIDFGLAKQVHLHAELTGTGQIFGTPYYMSPEQGHGDQVDIRSDIYSLGVIYFEMLTGKKPYDGDTAMAVIVQHQSAPIPRLPPEVAQFQSVIDRMMAKRPADRFPTVADLLDWVPAA